MICDYCGKELDFQRTEVGTEYAACENPDCPGLEDARDEMRLNGYVDPVQPMTLAQLRADTYDPFFEGGCGITRTLPRSLQTGDTNHENRP